MEPQELLDAQGVIEKEKAEVSKRQEAVLGKVDDDFFGVAFSGGGIRSASFNLGIVQGLTNSGLLPRVDYLSTVSGGGYVGSWLHGVIKRFGGGDPRRQDLKKVLTRPESEPHLGASEDPIHFIRQHTSYLAPNMGLTSPDFWVLLGIYFRNILLNQLILLPFLAAVCLFPVLLGSVAGWYANLPYYANKESAELAVTSIAALSLVFCAGKGVASTVGRQMGRPSHWDSSSNGAICGVLALFATLSLSISSDTLNHAGLLDTTVTVANAMPAGFQTLGIFAAALSLMFGILQWQGRFGESYARRHGGKSPIFVPPTYLYPIIPGVVTAGLIFGLMKILVARDADSSGVWQSVAWGPPLLCAAVLVGGAIHIGLMGVDYADDAREWLARLGAISFQISVGWAALFVVSVVGPYRFTQLAVDSWKLIAALGGGWVATSVSGALLGSRSDSAGSNQVGGASKGLSLSGLLMAAAPSIFVFGYMLLLSLALHQTVARVADLPIPPSVATAQCAPPQAHPELCPPESVVKAFQTEKALLGVYEFKQEVPIDPDFGPQLRVVSGLLLGCLLLIWYLPRRIDVNEFSMHHFYKNRLVCAFLGATNVRNRRPSRFTGFDPKDDMPLSDFVPSAEEPYFGPYPLINCCLNVTMGADLATAERKGASFLFAPLYSGFDAPKGYRKMKGFGYPEGYSIGTCFGISGAAASPNGGASTSAPMAFLMTLFCVRMGWWVGNTKIAKYSSRPGPRHSLRALLAELFANTDADFDYLNISDGGHYENLALYELIRRRCRFIVSGDGEEDGNYTFESLGGAVRKCRIDFGAVIDIDPTPIRPKDGLSGQHCRVGKITYALQPGETKQREGWLLYLKSSFSGDESADVMQYKSSHPNFPQQPTANQFFNESQFESYRKLGLHVWQSAFEDIDPTDEGGLEKAFILLNQNWGKENVRGKFVKQ